MSIVFCRFEVHDGFQIRVALSHDEDAPTLEGANPTCEPLLARVSAFRCGIELATRYLGGCYYDPPKDFLYSGYYEQLRKEVVEDAEQMIKNLQEKAE